MTNETGPIIAIASARRPRSEAARAYQSIFACQPGGQLPPASLAIALAHWSTSEMQKALQLGGSALVLDPSNPQSLAGCRKAAHEAETVIRRTAARMNGIASITAQALALIDEGNYAAAGNIIAVLDDKILLLGPEYDARFARADDA